MYKEAGKEKTLGRAEAFNLGGKKKKDCLEVIIDLGMNWDWYEIQINNAIEVRVNYFETNLQGYGRFCILKRLQIDAGCLTQDLGLNTHKTCRI